MVNLLDDVNQLLKLKRGDLGRLEHIKKTLEAGKVLYISDTKYLQEITKEYLEDFDGKRLKKFNSYDHPEYTNRVKDTPTAETEHISENMKSSKTEKVELTVNSFCSNCGNSIKDGNFCSKCGSSINLDIEKTSSETNNTKYKHEKKIQKKSKFWYLLPIVFGLAGGIFGIVGGLIAYLVLRKSDPKKGKYCLIIGITFTIIGIIFGMVAIDSISTVVPSTSEPELDFFEQYWKDHPEEDPCNDPTARAFGLCN